MREMRNPNKLFWFENHSEDLEVDARILKFILRIYVWEGGRCLLDSYGLVSGPVAMKVWVS